MMRTHAALALSVSLVLASGCRGDDENPPPDSGIADSYTGDGKVVTDGAGPAKETTIWKITDGTIAEGANVLLKQVVVTAVDGYGQYTGDVYVQEQAGLTDSTKVKGSGLKLFNPVRTDGILSDLKPGDLVKVEGKVKYFTPKGGFNDKKHPNKEHIKELEKPKITRIGPGSAPTPTDVTAKDLTTDPTAEGYEFTLVRIKDVRVTSDKDKYDEFWVTGSLKIADDMFPYTPKKNDCISVTGISLYFYDYKLHPRSAADVKMATGCPKIKDVTIKDIQDTSSSKHPAKGDQVKVTGVVISAVDQTASSSSSKYTGFWVQDPAGGPYSGIYVYYSWDSSSKLIPKEGDTIDLTATYDEYKTVSELKYPDWTVKGTGTIAPATVAAADVATGGSKAEQYEGVLVTVQNLKVDEYVKTTGTPPKDVGFKDSTSKLLVQNELYDFMATKPTKGTTFKSVTGPLHYSFSEFKILPRKAADLVK